MMRLLLAAGCLGLLALFATSMLHNRRRRRRAATRIVDCKDGAQVKLVGKVVAVQTLTAPATGRACVAYSVTAQLGRRMVIKQALATFIIDDGTAQAIVDCGQDGKVGIDLDPDASGRRFFQMFKPEEVPGLRSLGLERAESLTEGVLMPGERVAVFGEAQLLAVPGSTAQSGYRDGSVTRVRIVRPPQGDFLVTGKPYFFGET